MQALPQSQREELIKRKSYCLKFMRCMLLYETLLCNGGAGQTPGTTRSFRYEPNKVEYWVLLILAQLAS